MVNQFIQLVEHIMYREIGSFDAKTHLARLLREVGQGERYTITVRGRPVADLVPTGSGQAEGARDAVEALRALEPVPGVDTDELLAWIAEGRR
jgi:prevent-host-death family protein